MKFMNNQKGVAPVIIVLIVIALLTGGFLAYQYLQMPKEKTEVPEEKVEEETANWKVYRSIEYGFEMKYPEGWSISSGFGAPTLKIDDKEVPETYSMTRKTTRTIFYLLPTVSTQKISGLIKVEIRDNLEKKSLLSVLGYDPASCKIEKEQDTFAKISCEEVERGGAFKAIGSVYSKNDRVYVITLMIMLPESLAEVGLSSEINTYNLMLSTFKFLE